MAASGTAKERHTPAYGVSGRGGDRAVGGAGRAVRCDRFEQVQQAALRHGRHDRQLFGAACNPPAPCTRD